MFEDKPQNTYRSLLNSSVKKATLINSKNIEIQKKKILEEKGERSILQKLIQNKLNSEIHYQDQLIQIKQVELQLLSEQQIFNNFKKTYKKSNQTVINLKDKIKKQKQVLFQKQKYLQNYYSHLDNKFKSNINSQLFSKLQKLQVILNQKYDKVKEQLSQSLQSQNQKAYDYNDQLQDLRNHRDQLTKSILNKAFDESERVQSQYQYCDVKVKLSSNSQNSKNKSVKSSQQQRKEQYRKRKDHIKQQRESLRRNIKKLKKQKEVLESQQKMLKLLLNIDQGHKKHSYLIINGLRKMIIINQRNCLFKKIKTLKEDLPSKQFLALKEDINMKIEERNILKQELSQRINNLQIVKHKLNDEIGEYSQLQTQIMRNSNRISHDQLYSDERQSKHDKTYRSQQQQYQFQ